MDWKEVAARIAEIAPVAGATLGGPLGAGLGIAIKALAGAFGIQSPSPQPQEVLQAIKDDPQALLKLDSARLAYEQEKMRLEYEEKDKVRDDEIEALKHQLGHMQNARAGEVEIIKVAGGDWDKRFLTILGAMAPLAILTWIVIDGFPNLSTEITLLVGNLMGILFAKYSTIFDYHMGTSSRK